MIGLRSKFFIPFSLVVSLLVVGCSQPSLEKSIQSKWDAPIHIELVDTKQDCVIFRDGSQYVFNTFRQTNGMYSYSTKGEDGWTVNSPLLLRVINRPDVGNIIWGVVKTSQSVKRVVVKFINKQIPSQKVSISCEVRHHTFVGVPMSQLYNNDTDYSKFWKVECIVYNDNGKVLISETF